ncbi:hypothetical protein GGR57DRAFT_513552 [Xylariaceae sp. FL1272]|nr:hypothetical protein GGR57DRAFT_513552 [Xylariaceae sp. FL1272]
MRKTWSLLTNCVYLDFLLRTPNQNRFEEAVMDFNKCGPDELAMNLYNSKGFEFEAQHFGSFMNVSGNGMPTPLPAFCDEPVMQPKRGQSCVFRYEVLDECYKSRFWALALEFYLLKGIRQPVYRCLMANCPERDFKTPEKMLEHLKYCKLFSEGRFFCPVCNQIESFRTVSKKKCSWDRINFGRKVLEKYKSVFREFAGSRSGLLCAKCKTAQVYPSYTQDVTCCDKLNNQDYARPADAAKELQSMHINELDSDDVPSRHLMMSHQKPLQERAFKPQRVPSELSPDSARGHGKSVTVSPASDNTPPEAPALDIDFPSTLLSRAHRRMEGVHSEYDVRPHNETYADHFGTRDCNSFMETGQSPYGPLPISPFFPEDSVALNAGPVSVVRQTSRRKATPSLTVYTSEAGLQHTQWEALLLDANQTLDPSTIMGNLSVEQLPPRILTTPSGTPATNYPFPSSDLILSNESTSFQSSPSNSLSSSNTEQSPNSLSSATELKCPECGFMPKGKAENLRAYFRKHQATHNNSPIPCNHCGKHFTRQDNLTSHISKVHRLLRPKRRYNSSESLRSAGQSRRKNIRVAESFGLE